MAWVLFLLFVGLPIAEIAVLIQAGDAIGLWPTIGLVILTAMAGAALARSEGRAAMQRLAASVEEGGAPIGPLLDAAAIFIGGVLLLTPGFITDTLGLTLLFRPTRLIWGQILVRLQRARRRRPQGGPFGGQGGGAGGGEREPGPRRTVIIEGDYVDRGSERQDAGGAESAEPPQVRSPPDDRPKDRGGI